MLFLNLLAPWRETFADARDGDGGRGEQFRIILVQKICFRKSIFSTISKNKKQQNNNVFIYTVNDTEHHRNNQNNLKTSMYSPKHINNTKTHVIFKNNKTNSTFSKR